MDSSGPSGFRNAPVTKFLVQIIGGCSLAVSLLQSRSSPIANILRNPVWRAVSPVIAFPALGPGVVGTFLIYRMRVVERLYGSPKYAAFLFFSMVTSLVFQVGFKGYNGPYALVFAMLYHYHHIVPVTSQFSVASGVVLNDKMYVYMAALQLLFSPTSVAPSLCGFIAGMMYHMDLAGIQRYRFPQWLFPRRRPVSDTPSVPGPSSSRRQRQQPRQHRPAPSPPRQQPTVTEENVNAIASMFPDHSRDAVTSALVSAHNDMNRAAEILLTTAPQQS
ncbi:hypothetical protein BDA99DRAFT_510469 [Phascolomyces articulosus]|uniref:CUE domain-containing protein n=1 Tax=Phascolomyces articulosus TaxID=60185 RepID=A0AAD5KCN5_9FUNG|nr:hypothetical protein BDA99DRAFT_510469 [Phascolomyces articulosus]